ncbi:MAG TPA: hypothetical protein VJU59_29765, partial [Paraburkholderia sp.]|uniref:hypothetical protein n=1 Tax=Paraburkholderia sp. TaxID=1926495 RepID=UPI002B485577
MIFNPGKLSNLQIQVHRDEEKAEFSMTKAYMALATLALSISAFANAETYYPTAGSDCANDGLLMSTDATGKRL